MKLKNLSAIFKMRTLNKHAVLWIALLSMLVLSYFAKDFYRYFDVRTEKSSEPISVQTVRVKEASIPEIIETVGNLTAEKELKIRAVTSGKIQKLLVESGSLVKEGTLLAHIIAGPELRAPFDGYLTDWLVKPGEYVTESKELIELVNTEILSLTYKVPESYASKLKAGQIVQVSVKSFPEKIFQGTVRFVSPVVDRKTYTILIRANLENPDKILWPGMSAHVKQIVANHPHALVIPESCLILTMEGYEVMVVAENKIQKREIEIGERNQGRVHVLSGLSIDEPVILVRTNNITEGAPAVANDWPGEW